MVQYNLRTVRISKRRCSKKLLLIKRLSSTNCSSRVPPATASATTARPSPTSTATPREHVGGQTKQADFNETE